MPKVKQKQTDNVCDSYCRGCVYFYNNGSSDFKICEYMLQTGNTRPCKAGTGCAVKKERKRRRMRYE